MPPPVKAASDLGLHPCPLSKLSGIAMPKHRFLKSETVRELVGFITAMDEAVKGVKVSDACPVSAPVQGLLAMLHQLGAWVDEIPPLHQAMRYGNPAYRCACTCHAGTGMPCAGRRSDTCRGNISVDIRL